VKRSRTNSPKQKDRASQDDCANERPNNNFEPSAAFNQVAQKIASNAAEHSTDYGSHLQLCSVPVCHQPQSLCLALRRQRKPKATKANSAATIMQTNTMK
jgi:hypothetical protein